MQKYKLFGEVSGLPFFLLWQPCQYHLLALILSIFWFYRTAIIYNDEYLAKLLPPIHIDHDDRTALTVPYPDHTNPYKKKFDFNNIMGTYVKQGADNLLPSSNQNGYKFVDSDYYYKKQDAEIRKVAREKYRRKDHVDFLVNCRISEIINKKLEIESRLHIKQAENESYNHSR